MLDKRMRTLRQFGALVLLLAMSLAPAMACVVPDAQMTTQDRACCRMMNYQCGQMHMSESSGCCEKAPPSAFDNALATRQSELHPVAVSVVWLTASLLFGPTSSVTGRVEHHDYSPPIAPPSAISILRI